MRLYLDVEFYYISDLRNRAMIGRAWSFATLSFTVFIAYASSRWSGFYVIPSVIIVMFLSSIFSLCAYLTACELDSRLHNQIVRCISMRYDCISSQELDNLKFLIKKECDRMRNRIVVGLMFSLMSITQLFFLIKPELYIKAYDESINIVINNYYSFYAFHVYFAAICILIIAIFYIWVFVYKSKMRAV